MCTQVQYNMWHRRVHRHKRMHSCKVQCSTQVQSSSSRILVSMYSIEENSIGENSQPHHVLKVVNISPGGWSGWAWTQPVTPPDKCAYQRIRGKPPTYNIYGAPGLLGASTGLASEAWLAMGISNNASTPWACLDILPKKNSKAVHNHRPKWLRFKGGQRCDSRVTPLHPLLRVCESYIRAF